MRPRRSSMSLTEYVQWAEKLAPDFIGPTASGARFALLTWNVDGSPYWVVGWDPKSDEKAIERARTEAVRIRMEAARL